MESEESKLLEVKVAERVFSIRVILELNLGWFLGRLAGVGEGLLSLFFFRLG